MAATKEQLKKIKFKVNCCYKYRAMPWHIWSPLKSCFSFSNIASEHQLRSLMMLEQDRPVLLVPNPFPSELLTVFFT